MHNYNLTFTDGKRSRCIVMEPKTEAEDSAGIASIFCGRLAGIERIIPDCPEKLPWKRDPSSGCWRLHRFTLRKDGAQWVVEWPGGSAAGGKDEVSAAVRENWNEGC